MDKPDIVIAVYIPGRKIVVYTGLLDYFKTDAEIAVIIGHEVSMHCVFVPYIYRHLIFGFLFIFPQIFA